MSQEECPAEYVCPISSEIMNDPVMGSDGHSYERKAIEDWLKIRQISPMTREAMDLTSLKPNFALRNAIERYLKDNGLTPTTVKKPAVVPLQPPEPTKDVDLEVKVSQLKLGKENLTRVSISAPDNLERQPTVFIAILDVSGSMASESALRTDKDETGGFSRLDLVKHSMKTVISLLDKDYLSIITFSDRAKVVMPLTFMNDPGRTKAGGVVDNLSIEGCTNIWDALRQGMEVAKDPICQGKNTVLLLLTDGEPSRDLIPQPMGIVGTLKDTLAYNIKKGGKNDFTIHSFGFGYSLDTNLMYDICKVGGGSYGYIPDCSMVGTIFVNFMSNVLSTVARNVVVRVSDQTIPLGTVQTGQSRNVLLRDMTDTSSLNVTINFNGTQIVKECTIATDDTSICDQYVASKLQEIVDQIMVKGDVALGRKLFKEFKKMILELPTQTPFLKEMLRDTENPDDIHEGQLLRAVESNQIYKQWGLNHLVAFSRAHQLEQCINFKDKSLQLYSGSVFKELQEEANRIFCSLPPPPQSCRSYRPNTTYVAPANMGRYMNQYGGCFDGNGTIVLQDATVKCIKDLQKDDMLEDGGRVVCLVETKTTRLDLVDIHGVLLTPWHPVVMNGEWTFPATLKKAIPVQIPSIYNLVLEGSPSVKINGIECITLGHGLSHNDVVSHPYFGTFQVINDLKEHPGWERGHVVINNPIIERDASGLISKMF